MFRLPQLALLSPAEHWEDLRVDPRPADGRPSSVPHLPDRDEGRLIQEASVIHDPEDFKVGDTVFVTSLNLEGTVKEAANKSGDLVIQMGFLTSTVNYKNLELRQKENETKKPDSSGDRYSINKAFTIQPEINLLGNTVDEAINRLEKYLDDAIIAGLPSVRIVHGKGTGALRKGIHEYLRHLKFVKSYQLAELGEGDTGVTVVTFR